MSVEFEMPLFSLIFILMINIIYFTKKRVRLLENKYYEIILIAAFIEAFFDTIAHFICATNSFETITNGFYIEIFNWINRILVVSFSTVLSSLFAYILIISYNKIREKTKTLNLSLFIFNLLVFIATLFGNVELMKIGSVTNVTGWITNVGYASAAIVLIITIIIITINLKKIDKRYISIFLVTFMLIIFYGMIIYFPALIIYDIILAIMCYTMYFTIENPDLKMIEQLNTAKDAAEKANSAKTDFLSNMSHEIRTPLNAIVGFSQSLLEEDLSEDAKDEVKDIISASHSLLQIVNGILDISKIEANKLEIVNTEYNFEKIFDESVSLTKGRLGGKPLEFRYSYDSSIPPVLYGDYVRIKQIIVNLLTNAVKYTKRGYIDFKVSSVRKDDICRIIISVEDSGIGIKEENINKLFSKFQRFDMENNITIEGTGLGLAITKKLIELMNGKIVVQSRYGEGSKFTVALDQRVIPKTLEELTEELATDEDVPFVGNGDNILVVDDNNINLKVAKRMLKSYNLNVELVSSGQECINKILDGNKYSLILLDDMMPKMTGVETLTNLKKIMGFDIPTIALTANAITGMREKYLESGFNDYLAKPIDKIELEVVLKKYLVNSQPSNNIDNSTNQVVKINDNNDDVDLLVAYGVDLDKSLELLGDMETFNDTLRDFKEESKTRVANIIKYKEEGDMPNYAILVHAMKSDAKYLGLTKLAELSFNHEMASKESRIDYVNINFQELMNEVNNTLELIDKYLERKGE